jgi:Mg2+/citrate symporter
MFLAEVIAVFGVILFVLSSDFMSLYIFLGASALTMLVNCPKAKEIEKIAEKMGR